MRTIVLSTLFETGESVKDSVLFRAGEAIKLGVISELPKISARKGNMRPLIVLEFPESDYAFWAGFYMGKDFIMSNREVFIAKE